MAASVIEAPGTPRVTEEELIRKARRRELASQWFWRIMGYVVVLGLWEYASGRVLEEALLPGPTRILETFFDLADNGTILPSFQATLTRIFWGVGLSFVIGAIIGILMQNRWFAGLFKDGVTVGLTAPGLIWALITAIIFGNRVPGPIIAIVLTTFALVTVNVSEGIKSLPKDTLDMARAFNVNVFDRNRHIIIPHLAPFLFTGLRFGFSIGWKVTVLTEVFSASSGIGFQMRLSQSLFQMDELLTWILMFFFFALFLEKVILQRFERRFFRWRKDVTTV